MHVYGNVLAMRHKAVVTTMITTFGLKNNIYSAEIISEVTLDDLFESND